MRKSLPIVFQMTTVLVGPLAHSFSHSIIFTFSIFFGLLLYIPISNLLTIPLSTFNFRVFYLHFLIFFFYLKLNTVIMTAVKSLTVIYIHARILRRVEVSKGVFESWTSSKSRSLHVIQFIVWVISRYMFFLRCFQ